MSSASTAAAARVYRRRPGIQPPPTATTTLDSLIRAQGNRCARCYWRFAPKARWPQLWAGLHPTLDHVVPRCRGGKRPGNLLAMHRRCNEAKGDAVATGCEVIWLALVNARLASPEGVAPTPDDTREGAGPAGPKPTKSHPNPLKSRAALG